MADTTLESPARSPRRSARARGTSTAGGSLAVLGLAQLMVVLDATIVNIALPTAQRDLGFSDADRQWVVTAYALAFGGLLLLGGRLADLFGRKRTFIDRPGRLRRRLRARRRGAPSFGMLRRRPRAAGRVRRAARARPRCRC